MEDVQVWGRACFLIIEQFAFRSTYQILGFVKSGSSLKGCRFHQIVDLQVPRQSRKAIMAIHIVLDHTGDSRQRFDPNDAGEGGAALLRADEIGIHRRCSDLSGSGRPDPNIRPERGRNCIFSQADRRLTGRPYAVANAISG